MTSTPMISPEQVKWIVDHNEQIRGSHRVQLLDAAQAWADDRDRMTMLDEKLAAIDGGNPSSMVLTIETEKINTRIYVGWQWLVFAGIAVALTLVWR